MVVSHYVRHISLKYVLKSATARAGTSSGKVMITPPLAPSPARRASPRHLMRHQTPSPASQPPRSTPRSHARSPGVQYSPYPQRTPRRLWVSESPAARSPWSDQASDGSRSERYLSGSTEGSARSTAQDRERPPVGVKPGRKPGPIWCLCRKVDPLKTHGPMECLACHIGSGKPQINIVHHVLECPLF
ncbi:unnamed protein product [Phytophthora fragariaefolia]|uniref:Unnamed protein product n=1 Tax=Phytophthora fragariaefolia TaxID=1490495 RepID=A0A9W6XD12_9STRA|nr:unnamed protein product [Phytophthora fragariaefolia]